MLHLRLQTTNGSHCTIKVIYNDDYTGETEDGHQFVYFHIYLKKIHSRYNTVFHKTFSTKYHYRDQQ